MSTLPRRIPVITAGEICPAAKYGFSFTADSCQLDYTVPQPHSGLDLHCDAGNMHVNELPFETCKASDDITRNVAQNIKKIKKINILGEYVNFV